jgi:hypothetical protein
VFQVRACCDCAGEAAPRPGGIGLGAALPALDPWADRCGHPGTAWLMVCQLVLLCSCLPMTHG